MEMNTIATERPLLSIVSPVYHGEPLVHELVTRLVATLTGITENFEIILVNDASPDKSWEKILEEASRDSRVKGVNLSRNFGQHHAISAGLSLVKGEWIIVMDCDLQDVPEEIPNLYAEAQKGFEIVYAKRMCRQDGFFKRMSSTLFHEVFQFFSGLKTDKTIANFGIYHKKVIDEFNRMPEQARSFGSLIGYLGFKCTAIPVRHGARYAGETSYTFAKLIHLAFDITIANSNRPLKLAVELGFLLSVVSFALALYNVMAYFTGLILVPGFTSTIFSIWFVGGLLLAMLGVVGLYVGKIFDQVKGRQIFVISEKVNFGE